MGFIDLKSERLELFELGIFGLEDMHEYSTKEQVYKYLEFPPQKTKEETKLYINYRVLAIKIYFFKEIQLEIVNS